jgi:hypothetical protein
MKKVNISTDESVRRVPVLISFEASPNDNFTDGEEVLVQLISSDGEKVGEPEIRSIVKTIDADDAHRAWYDAYVPIKRN